MNIQIYKAPPPYGRGVIIQSEETMKLVEDGRLDMVPSENILGCLMSHLQLYILSFDVIRKWVCRVSPGAANLFDCDLTC